MGGRVALTSKDQLHAFAERGYAVFPNVVPRRLLNEAQGAIDALVTREPPPGDRLGHHFYWMNDPAPSDPLLRLFSASAALATAEEMVRPLRVELPRQVQISLNIPPHDRRPGGPHLDGLTPPEPSGRPGTFTLLAGVFLTDQTNEDMGNLWVWPGTHRTFAGHLRARLRASHNCGTKCHVPALEEGVETAETPGDGFRAGWLVAA